MRSNLHCGKIALSANVDGKLTGVEGGDEPKRIAQILLKGGQKFSRMMVAG